jgi:Phosphotransferase enzyme family
VELAWTARNACKLVIGARMTDAVALQTLWTDAEAALRTAVLTDDLSTRWRLGDRLTTVADVVVLELREGDDLAAVLKLSRSRAGDENLLLGGETIRRLVGDDRLRPWRGLLPHVLSHGFAGERRYSVERAVPGQVGSLPSPSASVEDVAREAIRTVAALHRATGRVTVASPELVDRWMQPGFSLLTRTPMMLGPRRRSGLAERLRDRIHAGLVGRAVWVSRTHGDYPPGNVFHGPTAEVSGVIDWGQSREDDAALIDPMTYVLIDRGRRQNSGLGAVVSDICRGAALTDLEQSLLAAHRRRCPADPIAVDVAALLAWLRHVENNLVKSSRYADHPVWVRRTVETVMTGAARS